MNDESTTSKHSSSTSHSFLTFLGKALVSLLWLVAIAYLVGLVASVVSSSVADKLQFFYPFLHIGD